MLTLHKHPFTYNLTNQIQTDDGSRIYREYFDKINTRNLNNLCSKMIFLQDEGSTGNNSLCKVQRIHRSNRGRIFQPRISGESRWLCGA